MHFNADWRIWYKDALLIKSRTFEMFGHGFIIVSSQAVIVLMNQVKALFFLSVFQKEALTSPCRGLQRCIDWSETNHYPSSYCVSPPVLRSRTIYACCHSSWVTTNAEQELAETISTFSKEIAYFYIFWWGQAHLLQLNKQQMYEVTDSAYLACGLIFLGLELRYIHKVVYRFFPI